MTDDQSPDGTDLPIAELRTLVRDRYDPKYAVLVGSSVYSCEREEDVDLSVVKGGGFTRRFDQSVWQGLNLEVQLQGEMAFRSLVDQYFWYPDNLAAEIGKFSSAITVVEDSELKEYRACLTSPDPKVRFFIASYHLGQLVRGVTEGDGWNHMRVNVTWSVVAIASAYWNKYPNTLRIDEYLETLTADQRKVMEPLLDSRNLPSELLNRVVEFAGFRIVEWVKDFSNAGTVAVYYPLQEKGIRAALQRQSDGPQSEHEFEYAPM